MEAKAFWDEVGRLVSEYKYIPDDPTSIFDAETGLGQEEHAYDQIAAFCHEMGELSQDWLADAE